MHVARDTGVTRSFVLGHSVRRQAARKGKKGVTCFVECSVHKRINNVGYRAVQAESYEQVAHLVCYEWFQVSPPS